MHDITLISSPILNILSVFKSSTSSSPWVPSHLFALFGMCAHISILTRHVHVNVVGLCGHQRLHALLPRSSSFNQRPWRSQSMREPGLHSLAARPFWQVPNFLQCTHPCQFCLCFCLYLFEDAAYFFSSALVSQRSFFAIGHTYPCRKQPRGHHLLRLR